MRVLLLSHLGSSHTVKWAQSLSKRGIEVAIFGLTDFKETDYAKKSDYASNNILIYACTHRMNFISRNMRYLKSIFIVRKIIRDFRPHLVHAHYATSYGLIGRFSGFKPLLISVWGSDVFDFPNQSILHKWLIKYILRSANKILSTSKAMALEVKKYLNKKDEIHITPFGIDINRFIERSRPLEQKELVIGTVKVLTKNYGIDTLIRTFGILCGSKQMFNLKLMIVGEGEEEESLKQMAKELGLETSIDFMGHVHHEEVPEILGKIDIFVALSINESFGVSILEASACKIPVVVSDALGLVEVVDDGITGIIVPKNDPAAAAKAIQTLIDSRDLRIKMGEAGRLRVTNLYDWSKNVDLMKSIYKETLNQYDSN